tara:strand:- start:626 stop:952 length:327 start_codon:yes stop_codon:yes gene_type:complete
MNVVDLCLRIGVVRDGRRESSDDVLCTNDGLNNALINDRIIVLTDGVFMNDNKRGCRSDTQLLSHNGSFTGSGPIWIEGEFPLLFNRKSLDIVLESVTRVAIILRENE